MAVGIAKLEFYNNLRKSADVSEDDVTTVYPTGYVHLPKIDAEFIQQLCAEQLITRRDRNGFPVREWQKMRERNEALDCYVYARAAASAAGLDRFEERHWRELERQLGLERPPDEPPPIQTYDPDEATNGHRTSGGLSGASATEAQSSLLQFGQALASGVLRGEEFNSVVENSPRLAQALADGLNVPIGRLRKLAEEGRLTADVVVNALMSQKDKLASEYAQLPATVTCSPA